jgi:hypothetical protein
MSKHVKLTDVVRKYNGEDDVVAWLDRLELVAGLQEISDLAPIIPLFLEGPAYDVYAQMSVDDRKVDTTVKKRLRAAFGITSTQAYSIFKSRSLRSGESPDAFVADLRRLARTVCEGGEEATVDMFVVCQFVDGLPEPTRSQIRALKSGSGWDISAILECAKGMLQQPSSFAASGLLGQATLRNGGSVADDQPVRRNGQSALGVGESDTARPGSVGLRCWACNKIGHVRRDCQVRCHACGERGHLRTRCDAQAQGNGKGGAA